MAVIVIGTGTAISPGVIAPTPILQFLNNAGQPNIGGSLLLQVGGVNSSGYSDVALTQALPNPIPLNSRGEVSTAAGTSSQLFLQPATAYTFTLYDANSNQLWQAATVAGSNPAGQTFNALVAGTGISINNSNPSNPVISVTGVAMLTGAAFTGNVAVTGTISSTGTANFNT